MTNGNFNGIDMIESEIDLNAGMAAHNEHLAADIAQRKDCPACIDFPLAGHYCKKHTCIECGKFDDSGAYVCNDCIPF